MDDSLLTVYRNDFILYIRNDMYSIFTADRMNGMLYRFADKNSFILVEKYMDYQWTIYMTMMQRTVWNPTMQDTSEA